MTYETGRVAKRSSDDGSTYLDVEVLVRDVSGETIGRAVLSLEPTGECLAGANGWDDWFGWRGPAVEGADREEMWAVAAKAVK